MIRINLLPQEASSKAAAKSIGAPSSGGALVAVALILAYALVIGAAGVMFYIKSEDDKKTQELVADEAAKAAKLRQLQSEYEEVRQLLETLRNQIAILEALDPEERLFWAEKLNLMPLVVTDGVFLTKMAVTEDVRQVETAESKRLQAAWNKGGKKGPQPKKIMRPLIRQTFTIEGVAYVPDGTSDDRLQAVIDFYRNLESGTVKVPFSGEETTFIKHFEPRINFSPFEGTRIAGREVTKFTFTLNSRAITAGLE